MINRWVQIPPSPVERRYQKVSSFFMPRQRMKPSGAGNRIRPPPVAGEGSMRFCEKQVVQANAQKHADFEQRQEGRGLLREIRSLKPEKTGAQTTIFRGGPFKSLLLRLKSPDFSGLIFLRVAFRVAFLLEAGLARL